MYQSAGEDGTIGWARPDAQAQVSGPSPCSCPPHDPVECSSIWQRLINSAIQYDVV